MPATPVPIDPAATFGLVYGGVELLVPPRELCEEIERIAPPLDVPVSSRLGWPASRLAGLTGIGSPGRRPVKLNTLWWPTGASRFAVGYFLCSGEQLKRLYGTSLSTGGAPPPYALAQTLHVKTEQGRIFTDLFMLPPRPLSSLKIQTPYLSDLYLLTLVDDRFWWWYVSTGDINLTDDTTTWSALYTQVIAGAALDWSADAVDADLVNAPKDLRLQYESMAPVLDAVAYNAGQRIVRKLNGGVRGTGNVTSVQLLQANLQQPEWTLLGGGNYEFGFSAGTGYPADPNYATPLPLPEKLSVAFRDYAGGSPLQTFTNVVVNLTDADPNFVTTPGGVKVFKTERPVTTGAGIPFAKAVTKAWGRQQLAPVSRRYAGIVPWELEGLSDSVEWCYRLNECHTTIHRPPWDDGVSQLLGPDNTMTTTTGLSVTKTVVVAFDPDTCAVTTEDWTFTNGVLTAVA